MYAVKHPISTKSGQFSLHLFYFFLFERRTEKCANTYTAKRQNTERYTDMHTCRHTDNHADGQTWMESDKQIDRQKERHTYTHNKETQS